MDAMSPWMRKNINKDVTCDYCGKVFGKLGKVVMQCIGTGKVRCKGCGAVKRILKK